MYCGLLVSSLIPGEVIEGKHPPLVSKKLFLKVNDILKQKNYGGKYTIDDENLPLKQFIKSENCGTPFTGYLVKKKGLYYYKNNRIGAKENRSAKVLHAMFEKAIKLALDLPKIWASGNLEEKRRIQKLVFPEGILYNREKTFIEL